MKNALARLVTLLLLVGKPDRGRIHAANTTAKYRAFGPGNVVPVSIIFDEPLRWPAFLTAANSHPFI
jgi:hypothetical protein